MNCLAFNSNLVTVWWYLIGTTYSFRGASPIISFQIKLRFILLDSRAGCENVNWGKQIFADPFWKLLKEPTLPEKKIAAKSREVDNANGEHNLHNNTKFMMSDKNVWIWFERNLSKAMATIRKVWQVRTTVVNGWRSRGKRYLCTWISLCLSANFQTLMHISWLSVCLFSVYQGCPL